MHHACEECSLHISNETHSRIFLIGVGPVIHGGHYKLEKVQRQALKPLALFTAITMTGQQDASQKWYLILRVFGVSQWYLWYTNMVKGFTNGTNGNTICTNGNANGTIGSPNGTIGANGKPMVPLATNGTVGKITNGTIRRTPNGARGWEPLKKRRQFDRLRLTTLYRVETDTCDIVRQNDNSIRGQQRLYQPTATVTIYKNSFSPRTIREWNLLPTNVTDAATLEEFRVGLGTVLPTLQP